MSRAWNSRAASGGRGRRWRLSRRSGEAWLMLFGVLLGLFYASYVAMPARAGAGAAHPADQAAPLDRR